MAYRNQNFTLTFSIEIKNKIWVGLIFDQFRKSINTFQSYWLHLICAFKLDEAKAFTPVAGRTGVQLVIPFYFRLSVVLFDIPVISSCHANTFDLSSHSPRFDHFRKSKNTFQTYWLQLKC